MTGAAVVQLAAAAACGFAVAEGGVFFEGFHEEEAVVACSVRGGGRGG